MSETLYMEPNWLEDEPESRRGKYVGPREKGTTLFAFYERADELEIIKLKNGQPAKEIVKVVGKPFALVGVFEAYSEEDALVRYLDAEK